MKGLQATEKIEIAKLLEEHKVSFHGLNGSGIIKFAGDDTVFSINDNNTANRNGRFKNGDKIDLTVSSSYIEKLKKEGKALDNKTISVEASGLKEIKEISNIKELFSQNDILVKSKYKNNSSYTYNIENKSNFIKGDSSSYKNSEASCIYTKTIYKITEAYKDFFGEVKTTVYYVDYGYYAYLSDKGELDLSTKSALDKYSTTKSEDYENLVAQLKTDGYVEFTEK